MLQAHSFLWHFLWIEPNVLLLFLGFLIWKRGLRRNLSTFVAFAALSSLAQLAVYTADISPAVSAENFWRTDWASLLVEGVLKFALIGEIFSQIFGTYRSVAKLGKLLFRGVGVVLVVAAALAAAFAPPDNPYGLIRGAHVLEQTLYLIESGALVFIFLLSYYFRLSWNRPTFGITLGLSISACIHLATWAVMANTGLSKAARYQLDFVNMATYNIAILIWYYFLLVPAKPEKPQLRAPSSASPAGLSGEPRLEEDIANWNEELERLLHQ